MAIRTVTKCVALLLVASGLTGCGGGGDSSGGSSLDDMAAALDAQVEVDARADEEASAAALRAEATRLRAEADRLAAQPLSEISIREDMVRGSKLDGGGYLSTTLRGGIAAEQKIGLAAVEHATNLYYGLEGKFPETHEDFMKDVVEFNKIPLEELKEPYEYRYDPETHKLMKRPKSSAIEAAEAAAAEAEAAADAAEAALAE